MSKTAFLFGPSASGRLSIYALQNSEVSDAACWCHLALIAISICTAGLRRRWVLASACRFAAFSPPLLTDLIDRAVLAEINAATSARHATCSIRRSARKSIRWSFAATDFCHQRDLVHGAGSALGRTAPFMAARSINRQAGSSRGRLDALADACGLSDACWKGATLHSASPDFFGLLQLKRRLDDQSGFAQAACASCPPTNLRDYLAAAASDALIDRGAAEASPPLALCDRPARTDQGRALQLRRRRAPAADHDRSLRPFVAEIWLCPSRCACLSGRPRSAWPRWPPRDGPSRRRSRPDDAELPVYSVLIPLRNEAQMVPQLFAAMWALDYPAERLDIKFVVEAASAETVEAVRSRLGDPRVSLVVVPDALPRTKPKALDYRPAAVHGRVRGRVRRRGHSRSGPAVARRPRASATHRTSPACRRSW